MAVLQPNTKVYYGGSPTWQPAFYTFNTTASTPLYFHFKTNIPYNTNIMFMIEAEGYNYGQTLPILCAWCGYPYSGTNSIIQVGLHTSSYNGLSADGVYSSSDGYVVLRAYSGSHYYTGFVLSAYMVGMPTVVSITAANQNSTTGNYY